MPVPTRPLLAAIALLVLCCLAWTSLPRTCRGRDAIACRIDRAKAEAAAERQAQAKTVEEAIRHYRHRYRRAPPTNFAVWAEFALRHNSPVLDNYDQIERDLQPLRKARLSSTQWQNRMAKAKWAAPGDGLGMLSIVDGVATALGPLAGSHSAGTLAEMLQPVAPFVPDVGALFNWGPQPLVAAAAPSLFAPNVPKNTVAAAHARLLPVLSSAKVDLYDDIVAPNVCYGHTDSRLWNLRDEKAFADKKRGLYWRRQGVLPLLHEDQMQAYLEASPPSLAANHSDRIAFAAPDAFAHQFILDMDGEGASCRFYPLLCSNSVVFKQTVWTEWHDDRLRPWLHYIPVDMDLAKGGLPTALDWFLHAAEGPRYAAMVAAESRAWSEQALRKVDVAIYYFRLLLELSDLIG